MYGGRAHKKVTVMTLVSTLPFITWFVGGCIRLTLLLHVARAILRRPLCAASDSFERTHQAFIKTKESPAVAGKMCRSIESDSPLPFNGENDIFSFMPGLQQPSNILNDFLSAPLTLSFCEVIRPCLKFASRMFSF